MKFLFLLLLVVIFGRLTYFAFKLTWGITKIIFTLVFLPISLIFALFSGLIKIAFPALLVIGVISLFTTK